MMKSPYHLLASGVLDLEAHPDVLAVMSFAKEVMDRFYDDVRQAATTGVTYAAPFLLMSFDKVTFGDPSKITELHLGATTTGEVGIFGTFEDELTAKEALKIFTWEENEVRTFMMMVLVSLRQIAVEGPSPMGKTVVQNAYDQLKEVLSRALLTRHAA